MKIYDTEGFPNPLRVRIALAEKAQRIRWNSSRWM